MSICLRLNGFRYYSADQIFKLECQTLKNAQPIMKRFPSKYPLFYLHLAGSIFLFICSLNPKWMIYTRLQAYEPVEEGSYIKMIDMVSGQGGQIQVSYIQFSFLLFLLSFCVAQIYFPLPELHPFFRFKDWFITTTYYASEHQASKHVVVIASNKQIHQSQGASSDGTCLGMVTHINDIA